MTAVLDVMDASILGGLLKALFSLEEEKKKNYEESLEDFQEICS